MIRYLIKSLITCGVGSLAYFLVFYVTFPSEEMRARLAFEADKAGLALAVGDISPKVFAGLNVDGISISTKDAPKGRGKAAPAEDDGGPPPVPKSPFLSFDSLGVDMAVLPLMRFSQDDREVVLDIDGALYDGELEGVFSLNKARADIDMSIKGLDLARYPMSNDDIQLDAVGKAEILTDISWSLKELRETKGKLSINLDHFALAKTSKIMGFELPAPLIFRESVMAFDVNDGKADLTTCSFSGDAVTLEGEGDISLNKQFKRSRLNLKFRFKLGGDLEPFAAFLPKKARSDDGWYHYTLRGTLMSPRFREDTASARKRSTKSAASAPVTSRAKEPLDDYDDEVEEEAPPPPKRPSINRASPKTLKKSPSARGIGAEELERRREERRRLAEDREQRREERLQKIREQREQMREQALEDGADGELVPPFPGDEDAPFRPPFGVRDIPRPPNVQDMEGDEGMDEEFIIDDEEYDEGTDEFQEPEIEIIEGEENYDEGGEGDYEEYIEE